MRRPALLLSVVAVPLAVAIASAAAGGGGEQPFTVKSTLAGRKVLPHRIQWLGVPSLAEAKLSEVDFLIDGKIRWREHHQPYTYGYDGNYLVSSWLAPGVHTFTVVAVSKDHRRATASSSARVLPAPAPPASLAGDWERVVTKDEAARAVSSSSGTWQLTIDRIGWRFRDPGTHGALVDVAYLSPGMIEARGGISTKLPGPGDEGNVWCDELFQPVRYRWLVAGGTLTLTFAGPKRCDGQSEIRGGSWTRVR
jgi:hypothetical protein